MKVGKVIFCNKRELWGFLRISDDDFGKKMVYFHAENFRKVRRNGKFDEDLPINPQKKKRIFSSLEIGKKVVFLSDNLQGDAPQVVAWGLLF